jgi:hypothetical protein
MRSDSFDNETWIVEAGDAVIQKQAMHGQSALSESERLVNCVWIADYSMRNAGDLDTASDLYPDFQDEASRLAKELSLAFTRETFSLPKNVLQQEYYARFDRICDEIKGVYRFSVTH